MYCTVLYSSVLYDNTLLGYRYLFRRSTIQNAALPPSYGSMDQIRATSAGQGPTGDDLERLFPERKGAAGLKTDDDTDPGSLF